MLERAKENLQELQFSSPEEELAYLREQVAHREAQLAQTQTPQERETIASQEVKAFRELPKEQVLPQERRLSNHEVSAIILDLPPEEDDALLAELLGVMQEQGVKNAMSVVERMQNPHLEDDFHRALVAYLISGYPAPGLQEGSALWEELSMVLFEVALPTREREEKEENRPIKELISAMEQLYAGLVSISAEGKNNKRFAVELAVSSSARDIVLYVAVPRGSKSLFEKNVAGLFPNARIKEEKGDYNIFVKDGAARVALGALSMDASHPIKTYDLFDHDPLNVMLNVLSNLDEHTEGASIQFVVQGAGERHTKRYRSLVTKLEKGMKLHDALSDTPDSLGGEVMKLMKGIVVSSSQQKKPEEQIHEKQHVDQQAIDQIKAKLASPTHSVNIRVAVSAPTSARADAIMADVVSSFNQFENAGSNRLRFTPVAPRSLPRTIHAFTYRLFDTSMTLPLSLRELSSLIHFPLANAHAGAPELRSTKAAVAPPPSDLAREGTLLGMNMFRGQATNAFLTPEDRLRHTYVIGQTGTGKTTLLKNMIMQDIQAGNGVCMIDPHGTDIVDVLSCVPPERHADVIYFDPGYTERVMGLNMLEYDQTKPEQKTFVVNELFSIFQKLYAGTPEAMGPAFEQYFRNATMLVLEDPTSGNTLLDVARVLADEKYRAFKLSRSQNPIVNQFWNEIAGKAGGEAALANIVPYITNKFDIFTANEIMRPIIAQKISTIDFRRAMDERKIVLVNLSKGKLGEINANLIGLILVGKILMAALSRVDGASEMHPFYLYIDEFQNVTTNSISSILSEARKYKLSLTVAHQYIAQLDEGIRDAVFGNVGSLAVFRVGTEDAEFLSKQFEPVFAPSDIIGLDNYNCYVKLLSHGKPLAPFNIQTLQPPETNRERAEYLKQLSYQTYGAERAVIEQAIRERYL